jgi:hypothetical protein
MFILINKSHTLKKKEIFMMKIGLELAKLDLSCQVDPPLRLFTSFKKSIRSVVQTSQSYNPLITFSGGATPTKISVALHLFNNVEKMHIFEIVDDHQEIVW